MYFILSVLSLLASIILLILYKVVEESILPIVRSKHTVRLRRSFSRAIFRYMIDIRDDYLYRIETILEPDGDEPFEPFLDSPLQTCPPTEFLYSPPKEELVTIINDTYGTDGNNNLPRMRRSRRRMNLPPIVPPLQPQNRNHHNPAVLVERIPPQQNPGVPNNLQAGARNVPGERDNRNHVRPRRLIQLLDMDALISPPPQQNPNEQRVFQFD